jgi:hypothetical protein
MLYGISEEMALEVRMTHNAVQWYLSAIDIAKTKKLLY